MGEQIFKSKQTRVTYEISDRFTYVYVEDRGLI